MDMHAVILSCTTLLEYVNEAQRVRGTAYPVIELDRKYHEEPEKMRAHILESIDKVSEEVDTILVAMGFCGGSWQDVTCQHRIVIPRVADCVALALTTPERYAPDLKKPGHMYLFGEGDTGFSIHTIYDSLREQYDEEMADIVFDMYFEHYYHVDIIDNGLYDCYALPYVEKAQQDADRIHAELAYVIGSNILLEKLVAGDWDQEFLVVEPGTKITQGLFYD